MPSGKTCAGPCPSRSALIHYNTPRVHNYQTGPDYASLAEEVPNLIGCKHVGSDVPEFLTLMAVRRSSATSQASTPARLSMMLGARGVYSWFTSFNPRYMLDWYDDIVASAGMQPSIARSACTPSARPSECSHGSGNLHGIINKAMGAASPFLVGTAVTRRPYLPVPAGAHCPIRAPGAGAVPGPAVEGVRTVVTRQRPGRAHTPGGCRRKARVRCHARLAASASYACMRSDSKNQ